MMTLQGKLVVCLLVLCISLPIHAHDMPVQSEINVSTSFELFNAVKKANKQGHVKIILSDGLYHITNTINITAPYVTLQSHSKDPNSVQLIGQGMRRTLNVSNLLRVAAAHFELDGITLQDTGNHLIQIAGEQNADFPVIKNCILKDAYEQILKVSYNRNTGIASDFGRIENCRFEYTKGIGPQYYIGGIDVHGGQDWVVKNNVFIGIASPGKKIAEHAVHFWNNTQNIKVVDNTIINCDRGIGFGMPNRPNFGGLIQNNLILHADNNHPNADTGIALEESQGTIVKDNRIFLMHSYRNAIEYRFKQTKNVVITNNKVNRLIKSRNGGSGKVYLNQQVKHLGDVLSSLEMKALNKLLKADL
ncbi:right-handed parallel beta-helix repeat-containing protein [Paraglaciecola aquimarina]|uniref:Right-handed parallel beta-helix repeat-containing protein n=1 Tax=Paraglaciecola algarum TaxID=3050085 RepID=A0ABS9D7H6_9ALTE|nr:right-handed parallel beta-helix repeat-containing protein [Paraglaciecola sp. G1-23]MCF2947769.1 right-handed parallel beta-helix repeat-containing protein [Paraglaciecola sp. G1-23]